MTCTCVILIGPALRGPHHSFQVDVITYMNGWHERCEHFKSRPLHPPFHPWRSHAPVY